VSPEKGIADFLDAARRLPKYRFIVAGSTDAMPEVTKRAPGNVEFKGFLQEAELNDVFHRSSCLCFELMVRSFPNVVAQSMAWGKPVIATRIGALPEIVDDGTTGLLLDPERREELAEKIDFLWRRPELCRKWARPAGRKRGGIFGRKAVRALDGDLRESAEAGWQANRLAGWQANRLAS